MSLASKPIVGGLEKKLGERLSVLRLNVGDEIGRRARTVYAVEMVPAAVLLNAAGSEVHRTEGKLPRLDEIRDRLESIERGEA